MKILLLGKNGQVGWELARSLAPLGTLVALDRRGADGLCGDLDDVDGIAATVRALRPEVVVNAAAYTAVDRAEGDGALARRINAEAPAVLARVAADCGAWLVHYSTDYVFDGSGSTPWAEGDAPAPLNAYGQTKLEGERGVQAAGGKHLIFRTSWVYAARGGNFIRTMLRLAGTREHLTVIDDQWGAPTGAELIADVTAHALAQALRKPAVSGLYHLAPGGETCWHDYARRIFDTCRQLDAQRQLPSVAPIATADYPTAARRPLNSRLATDKLRATFGLALPHWQEGVARVVAELLEGEK